MARSLLAESMESDDQVPGSKAPGQAMPGGGPSPAMPGAVPVGGGSPPPDLLRLASSQSWNPFTTTSTSIGFVLRPMRPAVAKGAIPLAQPAHPMQVDTGLSLVRKRSIRLTLMSDRKWRWVSSGVSRKWNYVGHFLSKGCRLGFVAVYTGLRWFSGRRFSLEYLDNLGTTYVPALAFFAKAGRCWHVAEGCC